MALQFNKTVNIYGKNVLFEKCYARIETINVNKEYSIFTLSVYSNSTTNHLIDQLNYRFVPDTSDNAINYHTQCYEYLKTLPEYADAIDV